jgi:hypothetical protein
MEDVGIFYGHLVYIVRAIWYILWPFCIVVGHFDTFFHFDMPYQEKSGNPFVDISKFGNLFSTMLRAAILCSCAEKNV